MYMWFHWNLDDVILFSFWRPANSVPIYILSCVIIFFLGFMHEYLRSLVNPVKELLTRRALKKRKESSMM